jgi:hypothetical protein
MDKITRNYNRVVEMAPEIKKLMPSTILAGRRDFENAISLAYMVGVLDGGQQVKEAIDLYFIRKEQEIRGK